MSESRPFRLPSRRDSPNYELTVPAVPWARSRKPVASIGSVEKLSGSFDRIKPHESVGDSSENRGPVFRIRHFLRHAEAVEFPFTFQIHVRFALHSMVRAVLKSQLGLGRPSPGSEVGHRSRSEW